MKPDVGTVEYLRTAAGVNVVTSALPGAMVADDFARMVAAVGECNARFEGFYLSAYLLFRYQSILQYPVKHVWWVKPDEAFGGMWSDLDENGIPKHEAAFVRLTVRPGEKS